MNITGIILTAGLSSRMKDFKPLLKLSNGKSFIRSITEKLSSVCNEIILVTGFKENEIVNELKLMCKQINFRTIHNSQYELGMFSSLKIGLEKSEGDWFFYHFVDQPNLPFEFYKEIIMQIDNSSDWIQPIFNNRKGHPILFNERIKKIILDHSVKSSLREISKINSIRKKYFEYNSEIIFQDIDTKEDYYSSTQL